MQDCNVSTGLKPTQNVDLIVGGDRLEKLQGLVSVRRQNDMIEFMVFAIGSQKNRATLGWGNSGDFGFDVDLISWKSLQDCIDVLFGSSRNGQPIWSGGDGAEQVMVIHEANQGDGGKLEGALVGTGTPDCGSHGDEVVVSKLLGVAFTVEVISNGLLGWPFGLFGLGLIRANLGVAVTLGLAEQ